MPDEAGRLIPLAQRAREWGLSPQRARELAAQGRIPGAVRVGPPGPRGVWMVPEDEPPPPRLPPGRPRNEEPRR